LKLQELFEETTMGNIFSQKNLLKVSSEKLAWPSDKTAENAPSENRQFSA